MQCAANSLVLGCFRVFWHSTTGDVCVPRTVFVARRDTSASSGRGLNRNQLAHPHQVVCRRGEGEDPSHVEESTMFELTQQCDVLQPAEALFDPLPLLLTYGVAGVSRGPRIDGAATRSGRVLRHVRCHVHVAAFGYELCRVKTLV